MTSEKMRLVGGGERGKYVKLEMSWEKILYIGNANKRNMLWHWIHTAEE